MSKTVEENNYYIYCISYHTLDNSVTEIMGHHNQVVFRLGFKELVAYVSMTACTHIETNYENLQCHENVIIQLMKNYDVLPMSFSTICKSKESIIEMLQKYYEEFLRNLGNITGKVELGIKVFYKLDFEEEDKKDKELLIKPKEYMMKRYERYCNRQKKIDEILYVIDEQHKALADIAVDNCYTKPLKNNLIFNASYLVLIDKKEGFDYAVDEMIKNNPAYKILYSGPWPAYHFVNIVQEGDGNE